MIRIVAAIALVLSVAQGGCAELKPGEISLRLPHALQANEIALVEVRVGTIGPGQEIEITTLAGRTLGVISPYAIRAGQAAGTYTLPVPAEVIDGDHLGIRLNLTQSHAEPRTPSIEEVLGVRVIVQEGPKQTL